jgi:hypothetical protein
VQALEQLRLPARRGLVVGGQPEEAVVVDLHCQLRANREEEEEEEEEETVLT